MYEEGSDMDFFVNPEMCVTLRKLENVTWRYPVLKDIASKMKMNIQQWFHH